MAAREVLTAEGIRTRVVSMPCWERFEAQPEAYRDEVLPPDVVAPREHRGRRLAGLGPLGAARGRHHRPRPVRRFRAGASRSSSTSASRSGTSPRWPAASSPARSAASSRRGRPRRGQPGQRRSGCRDERRPTAAIGTATARAAPRRGRADGHDAALPGDLRAPVDEAIARAVDERWASRIWARDTRLWTDGRGGGREDRAPPRLARRARRPSRPRSRS